MAQAPNTFDSYEVIGNREDLSEFIFDVSPWETPVINTFGTNSASNTLHEWQTDQLAPAGMNHNIEGDDRQDADTLDPTVRLNNITPILKKKIVISGTQEDGMNHAGVQSEVAYQEAKKMREIKKDCEFMVINGGEAGGIGNVRVSGNSTTPREMSSLQTYISTNTNVGATGSAPTGDGSDAITAGTPRDLTEDLVTDILTKCYVSGGEPSLLVTSAINKGVVSDFDGGSTRYIDTNTKELVHSIDVYVGDFHTLKVIPSRHTASEIVYALDPEYAKLSELRPLQAYDLAKTGDNYKREMVWELTLEVCNGDAHGMITDTNG